MNTLNIVTERKAQILAENLENRMVDILDQISDIHGDLLFAVSFNEANKCNKQLKNLLNNAVYYMIVADNLATKYQGVLTNSYSITSTSTQKWIDLNMYSILKGTVKELSSKINKLH